MTDNVDHTLALRFYAKRAEQLRQEAKAYPIGSEERRSLLLRAYMRRERADMLARAHGHETAAQFLTHT